MQHPHSAFSLVELSIVLVILGLLTGGILAGQSLIRAAELRSVSTDYNRYITATQTFRDKYFALPGDMPNATKFWGATNPVLATCKTTPSTGTSTCDGEGNGIISWYDGSQPMFYETFGFWKHLANAGLIEGSYSNVGVYPPVAGTNVPRSRINNAFFFVSSLSPGYSDTNYFTFEPPTNFMVFTTTNYAVGALKAEEAWNLDTKMDDGKPGLGAVKTTKRATCSANTATDAGATYALSQTANECELVFLNR